MLIVTKLLSSGLLNLHNYVESATSFAYDLFLQVEEIKAWKIQMRISE